ncbi:MAG: response regulator transcription factor [Planctomycetes bacterium]|nr:response regulator transcription factor [Planctomycetota bacterium]
MIVDDHAMVRSGLGAFMLAFDDLELIGEAGSGEEAVDMCAQLQPDVVLMDLMMPGMGGVAAIGSIKEQCPKIQVIALTSFAEQEHVQGALKGGAIGYLMKNVSADDLVNAIRDAMSGKPSLAPEAARALIQSSTEAAPPGKDLTETERGVLKLMVEGLNNPDIAERLMVSTSTVKFHVSNILSKLGVTGRTEAVALAVKHKLVN